MRRSSVNSPLSRARSRRPPGSSAAVSWAALLTSVLALILSASGWAGASVRRHAAHEQGAVDAKTLDGKTAAQLEAATKSGCPHNTTDLGTWCLMSLPYPVPSAQAGDNNYFYAAQTCVKLGGYLPTAAQLIGAAPEVALESVITDSPSSATIETDPTTGLQDQREMSATLVTTAAGSDAAGSEGVSVGATGNPNEGQPDPTPQPANPEPETLQYVTVYDNHNKGGFAGSEPVSSPENFRCAFEKVPGGSLKSVP